MLALGTCCDGQRDRPCATCGGSLAPLLGIARTVGALWAQEVGLDGAHGPWQGTLREAGRRVRLAGEGRGVVVWRWLAERCLEAAKVQWAADCQHAIHLGSVPKPPHFETPSDS